MDKKNHSRNTVSCPKSLRIQAFESLEAFKMYYAIGASVLSLHGESSDSDIYIYVNDYVINRNTPYRSHSSTRLSL